VHTFLFMKPAPYESKYTYYGDEWLEFHDYLSSLTDREGIFIELLFRLGVINPRELAYKIGKKHELLRNIQCNIELDREEDQSKHAVILKEYGLVFIKPPEPKTDINDSGIM